MLCCRVVSLQAGNPVMPEYFNQSQSHRVILLGLELIYNVKSLFHIGNVSRRNAPCFKPYMEAGIGYSLQYILVVWMHTSIMYSVLVSKKSVFS